MLSNEKLLPDYIDATTYLPMLKYCFLFYLSLLGAIPKEPAHCYYLSAAGNDQNNGLSPATAWRSLDRLKHLVFKPGDRILLEGGATFYGQLLIGEQSAGDAANPVVVTTFGVGRATIDAGDGTGLLIHNTGGVRVANINVKGNGVGKNAGNGIECLVDKSGTNPRGIWIDSCQVSGFHRYGILLNGSGDETCGFQAVKITNCEAFENGEAGIASWSYYPSMAHRDLYVAYCKAHHNRGILSKTENHSGNGIVMSGVDGVLIEYCEAWENGADSRSTGGGPVGIWLWCCRNGVIQYCTSHHNHAGTKCDGGGFDIDGGASNCTIRYCLSHDNEGAGYLVCEFGCPFPCTNNTVTQNVSRNDGLNNHYGALSISGAGKGYEVGNTVFSHNYVYVSAANAIAGTTPAALYFNATDFSGIQLINNTFEVADGADVLHCDTLLEAAKARFQGNVFFIKNDGFPVNCKRCGAVGAADWRKQLQGL